MRRFLQALAFVLMPLTGWAQGTAENPQATFRSGVDLVTVSATVRDGKGRLVKDLLKKDFEVLDRGEKRAISEFRSERAPLSSHSLVPMVLATSRPIPSAQIA